MADAAAAGRRGGQVVVGPDIDAATHDHLRQLQEGDRHGEELGWVLAHTY